MGVSSSPSTGGQSCCLAGVLLPHPLAQAEARRTHQGASHEKAACFAHLLGWPSLFSPPFHSCSLESCWKEAEGIPLRLGSLQDCSAPLHAAARRCSRSKTAFLILPSSVLSFYSDSLTYMRGFICALAISLQRCSPESIPPPRALPLLYHYLN